jgi:hypothetical protein
MGQQQLLLIILGFIVVALGVFVGIVLFKDNAIGANRDAVTSDLMALAGQAQQYVRRPTTLGGGQGSFSALTADAAGLKKITSMANGTNANGRYIILTAGSGTRVVLQGKGMEIGNDGSNPVNVVMNVWADSALVDMSRMN